MPISWISTVRITRVRIAQCGAGVYGRFDQLQLSGQERQFVGFPRGRIELVADGPCTAEYGGIARAQVAQRLQSRECHDQPSCSETRWA